MKAYEVEVLFGKGSTRLEVFHDNQNRWHWRLFSRRDHMSAQSCVEGYGSRTAAIKSMKGLVNVATKALEVM